MGADIQKFENAKSKLESDFQSAWSTIKELADSGDEEAMIFVADCYYKGNYVEMNEALAYELFNKIVTMYPNNGLIWEKIADCHFYGYGVPKSHQEAINRYEKAWEHGYVDAASDIGWIYAFGDIPTNNEQTAAKWFQRAADKGGAAGKYFMGFFYDKGYGGLPVNKKLAHKYLMESASQDNQAALRYLLRERCFGEESEFGDVLNRMMKLADEGNDSVQYDLGISYLFGFGVEQDISKAQDYLQKASDAGNQEAMFELGKRLVDYDSDFIVDYEKGHRLLLTTAENGNAEAMYELYRYYSFHESNKEKGIYWAEQAVEHGSNSFLKREIAEWYFNEGDFRDIDKAIKYNELLLADNEDIFRSHAFLPLAICYLKRTNVNCDFNKVMQLLEQAKQCTETDDYFYKDKLGEVLYWMAYMTEKGLGTTKNLELAYNMYSQSANLGYEEAKNEIPLFKKSLFGWKKL